MRQIVLRVVFVSMTGLIVASAARSQFPEDALRYSSIGLGTGARALGMGMAYTGIASDFSAVYWNPAGLGQIEMSELNVGLSHQAFGNTATFLGTERTFDNSSTDVNNFGLVYPFPTTRGSLVFAVGYARVNDFTSALSFDGFNHNSSIIPTLNQELAYELFLVDADGNTPLRDSLQQRGVVLEGGGLNNWNFAAAVEAGRRLYLGVSVNVISGSYSYNREYTENDIFNKFSVARFDTDYAFTRLNLINTISNEITGVTARLGMLYKFDTGARLGINIKVPSHVKVRENFSSDGTTRFDVPDNKGRFSYNFREDGKTDYSVVSPFLFSTGFSLPIGDLMIAGGVEYADWTQVKFSDADPIIEQYNTDIKRLFRPTANLRVGAEYELRGTGVRIRGGYAYLPSPFRNDPPSFAQKYITGGLGLIVQNSIAIDLAYAYGFWETFHVNYDASPTTSEKVRTQSLMTTVSYRF